MSRSHKNKKNCPKITSHKKAVKSYGFLLCFLWLHMIRDQKYPLWLRFKYNNTIVSDSDRWVLFTSENRNPESSESAWPDPDPAAAVLPWYTMYHHMLPKAVLITVCADSLDYTRRYLPRLKQPGLITPPLPHKMKWPLSMPCCHVPTRISRPVFQVGNRE